MTLFPHAHELERYCGYCLISMLFFKSFIELSPAAKVEMPGILLVASQSSGTQVTNFDMNQPGNLFDLILVME